MLVKLTLATILLSICSITKIAYAQEYDIILTTHREEQKDEARQFWGRVSSSLRKKIADLDEDSVKKLRIPILLGVSPHHIIDSWGDARSNGRTHEGTDIIAPKGMYVVSPTEAVVIKTGYGENGGNYVYTANPGGETYYYAHLDSIEEEITRGEVLKAGSLIGRVGNTGNAAGGPDHLHLGIYTKKGPINPFPRLTKEFSPTEKLKIIQEILKDLRLKLKKAD